MVSKISASFVIRCNRIGFTARNKRASGKIAVLWRRACFSKTTQNVIESIGNNNWEQSWVIERSVLRNKCIRLLSVAVNFNEEIVARLHFFGNKKLTICLLGAALVVMGNFIVCNSWRVFYSFVMLLTTCQISCSLWNQYCYRTDSLQKSKYLQQCHL